MENAIEIVRGTTNNFEITITDAQGTLYAPKEGDAVVFGVKKNKRDQEFIFTKKAQVSKAGTARIKICPDDTITLCPGKYFYDVGIETGDDFYNIIPATLFYIASNVTEKGCAK